jgi:hypothetical protein
MAPTTYIKYNDEMGMHMETTIWSIMKLTGIEDKKLALEAGAGPYIGRGTGRHMPGGLKSQGWQNILVKLILKMMYPMKKIKIKQ